MFSNLGTPAGSKPPFDRGEFGNFLLNHSLYQKLYVDPPSGLPMSLGELLPDNLYYDCDVCKRNQPFQRSNSHYLDKDREQLEKEVSEVSKVSVSGGAFSFGRRISSHGLYVIRYTCSVCYNTKLQWFVELQFDVTNGQTYFRKVGQLPPFDISTPRDVEKRLGKKEVAFFRNARVCISQGYGIGACIYLRRLIEDQIDALLEIHLETRQEEGAKEEELERIKVIINEKMLENKIKLVTTKEEGTTIYPVGAMYDRLSDAIHNYSDNESIAVAQDVSEMFVDLIVRLKEQRKAQQEHLERLKRLRGR
jgi:hypothetical protein